MSWIDLIPVETYKIVYPNISKEDYTFGAIKQWSVLIAVIIMCSILMLIN